jgi:hypothetical protein
MCIAAWLVDASIRVRLMARYYSDDANEIYLLTHCAVVWLLRHERAAAAPVSHADLAAALCAAAHRLGATEPHEARDLRSGVGAFCIPTKDVSSVQELS